ncbi:helix-turn-helix transcriptional regulator [Leucobacter weissii]|uniref:Helix-turn-helix transcriptional regulator n=1 Tax=Leucobacter weissii TaxID=1983706 RepID=A0A939MQ20_9MICO|nr:AraC family transcriptional regulator [Leucobacter weissii]MBO1900949.1 helix-turn-helix transcriptional regulator [Leucobacter weissii]
MSSIALAPAAPRSPAPPPRTGGGATIEDVLAELDVGVRRQLRFPLAHGEAVHLETGRLSLVYLIEGAVAVSAGADTAAGDHRNRSAYPGLPRELAAGGVLLSSGRDPLILRAPTGASIVLSELDLVPSAAHLAALLPDVALVRGFDRHEPAAAALAVHLGSDGRGELGARVSCPSRDGDLVVCRAMARTVLLSAIRSWWRHGCAPEGWPSLSRDPFLDRVVAAVAAEPGRDWSVETLAATGAMSRSVFAERFRTAFGRSPAGYVAEVRMRAAKDLLARGRGVSEVSRELGYRSDEGFSRAFRRHTGVTPSAWRAGAN